MNLESGLIAVKYKLIIDESKEENIIITAHKKTDLILEIEKLINSSLFKLNGYKEDEIYPLELTDIYCFYTADSKIIAKTKNDEYLVKERIYGKNQVVTPIDETSTMVEVDMQNKENIIVFILGFNKYIKVLEPQWLKKQLAEVGKTLISNYNWSNIM